MIFFPYNYYGYGCDDKTFIIFLSILSIIFIPGTVGLGFLFFSDPSTLFKPVGVGILTITLFAGIIAFDVAILYWLISTIVEVVSDKKAAKEADRFSEKQVKNRVNSKKTYPDKYEKINNYVNSLNFNKKTQNKD